MLLQVIDIERDIRLAKAGKKDLVYKTLVGLKADLSSPALVPEILSKNNDIESENESEEYSDSNSCGSTDDETDDERENKFVNSSRPKN